MWGAYGFGPTSGFAVGVKGSIEAGAASGGVAGQIFNVPGARGEVVIRTHARAGESGHEKKKGHTVSLDDALCRLREVPEVASVGPGEPP